MMGVVQFNITKTFLIRIKKENRLLGHNFYLLSLCQINYAIEIAFVWDVIWSMPGFPIFKFFVVGSSFIHTRHYKLRYLYDIYDKNRIFRQRSQF